MNIEIVSAVFFVALLCGIYNCFRENWGAMGEISFAARIAGMIRGAGAALFIMATAFLIWAAIREILIKGELI